MIANNETTKNEFYICPLYNRLIAAKGKVSFSEIEKLHVLGTPEDLEFFVNRVYPFTKIEQRPIALCADHSGYQLKEWFKISLKALGYNYIERSCDYSDFVNEAIRAIKRKNCYIGFGFCRTGQGVNINANKSDGIYSALVFDTYTAEMSVRHNAANFFSIPSKYVNGNTLDKMFSIIVNSSFDGGRHLNRMQKHI
jgi:ribose 5-phosphate isomerase B